MSFFRCLLIIRSARGLTSEEDEVHRLKSTSSALLSTYASYNDDLSNRALFRVYIASSKHEEGWENSRQLCKPET